MNPISLIGHLLVCQWIWSITLGVYHPLINCVIMIPLSMYLAGKSVLVSLVYALSSQGFAIMVFGLVAHFVLGLVTDSCPDYIVLHPLAASLVLASLYASLQTLFFYGVRLIWRIPIKIFTIIVFLSNFIAALIVFRYVPTL